jgi:uncharacterized Ntn-hydrolase superfamily protein
MTFSLLGRCTRTGHLGAATATADIAVGARVPHARSGAGAVLTQHRTDPRLGPQGLDLLASGCDAAETVAALVNSTASADWRQLAAIDAAGRTAAFSGARVEEPFAEEHGHQCIALGNVLVSRSIGRAMVAAFEGAPGDQLAGRMVSALEAGLAAGGERSPVRSAAVLVAGDHSFALVDLRVDDAPAPVAALRALWEAYLPRVDEFVDRAIDPDSVPW